MDIVDTSDQGVPEEAIKLVNLPDLDLLKQSRAFADKLVLIRHLGKFSGMIVVANSQVDSITIHIA
ncbi:hypothetical protein MASR2M79_13290 [Aminivibrio sp.]